MRREWFDRISMISEEKDRYQDFAYALVGLELSEIDRLIFCIDMFRDAKSELLINMEGGKSITISGDKKLMLVTLCDKYKKRTKRGEILCTKRTFKKIVNEVIDIKRDPVCGNMSDRIRNMNCLFDDTLLYVM